ncbi:MAG: esterase-like activity of phytase family protein, partial [Thermodesulfobacteriota bacterium]
MRNRTSISVFILFIFTLYLSPFASGQEKSEAVLSGHAVVPLMSILTPPGDVPGHLQTSGKYTHPDSKRRDDVGAISGKDRNKPSVKDVFLPVEGQPFQGFSGIKMLKDGTAVIIT